MHQGGEAPLRTFTTTMRDTCRRTVRTAVALTAAAALVSACGSSSSKPSAARSSAASTTSTKPAASSSTSTPAGPSYSTRAFTLPLDIALPSFLKPAPDEDSAHFVTFGSVDDTKAIRILSPVALYRPNASATSAIPSDYVGYLTGLGARGAQITDRVDTKVDGHTAAIFTARTAKELNGTLGCPTTGMSADDCFGIQPDLALRIAVIDTGKGPLLIWLRLALENRPDLAAEIARFNAFLAGVRFATRAPVIEPAVDTKYDGTYTWTLTKVDATHDPSGPPSAATLATYPWVFTVVLDHGKGRLHIEFAQGAPEDHTSTFTVDGNRITNHGSGTPETFTVVQDPDGTLHLTAVGTIDPGDNYVNTTEPWTKKA